MALPLSSGIYEINNNNNNNNTIPIIIYRNYTGVMVRLFPDDTVPIGGRESPYTTHPTAGRFPRFDRPFKRFHVAARLAMDRIRGIESETGDILDLRSF